MLNQLTNTSGFTTKTSHCLANLQVQWEVYFIVDSSILTMQALHNQLIQRFSFLLTLDQQIGCCLILL